MAREKEAEKRMLNYFQSGYHCPEAILKTIVELHAGERGKEIPKITSSYFCGGIGGTHEDACGALAGSIIAEGIYHSNWSQRLLRV